MQKNSQNFSMQEALRLANSDAGQRLLAMLKEADSGEIQQAVAQAGAGDYSAVQKAFAGILNTPEAQALLKELEGQHGQHGR